MTTSTFDSDSHGQDTFAWASEPDRSHDGLTYAILQANEAIKYTYWPGLNNIPKDAVVDSAHYYEYTAGDWAGAVTLGISALEDSWTPAGTNWNNRPGITGPDVEVTHSPTGVGFEYDFNVITMVAGMIANGASKGFGLRRIDDGDAVRVWQRESNSPTGKKAHLIVVWHTAGQKPSRLQPDGIVGIPKPLLSGFPRDTQAVRIFADPSEDGFASPAWPSGTQPVDAPEFDLATSTFPGTDEGDSWWFEVSCLDQQGDWSDPSDPIEFTYVPLPELTLLSPSADNPNVTDVSFPVVWDVDDQKAYRVYITKTDGSGDILYDTGKIQDPDARSATIPGHGPLGHRILRSHKPGFYRAWVESFPSDTLDRVAMPGALQFSRQAQVFTLVSVPGVPPMSSLYISQNDFAPQVNLHAERDAGTPDALNVWRDGELIMDGIDPEDVLDFDEYLIVDHTAAPWTEHTWYVQAVVNGNASVPGPMATFTPKVFAVWLNDPDRQLSVCIWNPSPGQNPVQTTATDQASVTWAISAIFPDVDTSAIGAKVGTINGLLRDDVHAGGRTADSYRHDLNAIKQNPEIPVQLTYGNLSMPVYINDVDFDATGSPRVSRTRCAMTVRQAGPATIFPDNTDNGGIADPLAPDVTYRYADEGLSDGDPLTIGVFDITAVAGSPAGDDDAIIPGHTDTEGWS